MQATPETQTQKRSRIESIRASKRRKAQTVATRVKQFLRDAGYSTADVVRIQRAVLSPRHQPQPKRVTNFAWTPKD